MSYFLKNSGDDSSSKRISVIKNHRGRHPLSLNFSLFPSSASTGSAIALWSGLSIVRFPDSFFLIFLFDIRYWTFPNH